ncbi:MAG: DUF2207 domain-containing protein [Chloroflexi bacterium]|nr:DUF2207 domain-containing protein [Chloroflexota bacterium]
MRHLRVWIACALTAVAVIVTAASPALAESKSLQWNNLDVDITVMPNGELQIVETNIINFTSGSFSFGYRDIDTSRLTGIRDVQVTELGQPLQVETSRPESDIYRIKYYFSPARNEARTFEIAYTIQGAVRYYPEGDQVYWKAVYPDRNGYAVLNSRVTVKLPDSATATQAATYGARANVTGAGESTVVAVAQEPIDSGQELEIRVQFPHGILTGQAPPWQAAFDQQRTYEETTKPMVDLLFLLAGLVIFFGGPALAVLLWYKRGRDPNVGLVAEYLNEPPPDVSPGIAGTLVDERADLQDIIATLVDLARRGVLTMQEEGETNRSGLVYNRDWVFSRGPNYGIDLKPFESQLVAALDLTRRNQRELSDLKYKFYQKVDGIKNALYDQLVHEGLYTRSPEKTRGAYSALGVLLVVLTIVAGVIAMALTDITSTALCLPAALAVTTVAFFVIAQAMPSRTRKGADMKMRAEAFKRYLQNIEKYTDLKAATDQFDKYLPYAIAFGVDRTWINKFSSVDAPAPTWYIPYYGHGRGWSAAGAGGATGKGVGDISGAARAPASLEGVNKSLSTGLSNINTGLAAMFTSVATTFVSVPAPKSSSSGWSGGGGGWSGGGGGGGGGSGGGGGGFG